MAFGSIVAYVLLFSVGISAVVGLSFFYKDYVLRTTTSLDTRQEMLEDKEKSDILIQSIDYQSSPSYDFTLTTEKQFAEGIFENTNETNQSGNLTLDLNGALYFASGNWTSPIYDMGHEINFTSMNFDADISVEKWVGVQIRTSDSVENLIGNFIGPDGTSGTYYLSASTAINDIHDKDKVLQLRIYLNTTNTVVTPSLTELNITYSYVSGILSCMVENDGKVKLDTETLDIFLDDSRLPRTYPALSKKITPQTDIQNPGLWDPQEVLNISFPYELNVSENHILRIVTEYGTSDYFTYMA